MARCRFLLTSRLPSSHDAGVLFLADMEIIEDSVIACQWLT
jgi:hypothetical protein